MTEQKKRSLFAQALYDLMIVPGIYTQEFWEKLLNGQLPGIMFWGRRPDAAPVITPVQSWFDDKALPNNAQLYMIVEVCARGNMALFMNWLGSGMPKDPEFDAECERYSKGADKQAAALKKFLEILDKPIHEVSPLRDELPFMSFSLFTLGGLMSAEILKSTCWILTHEVPTEHRTSVIYKVWEVIRAGKDNNWYEEKSVQNGADHE